MPNLPFALRRRPGEPVWVLLEGQDALREETRCQLEFQRWYASISSPLLILLVFSAHEVGLSAGKELEINSLLPCSAALNGIGMTAMIDFLACVGVASQDAQYMKGTT